MKCTEKGCGGEIDFMKDVLVPRYNGELRPTHPCKICGLLHEHKKRKAFSNIWSPKNFLKGKKVIAGVKKNERFDITTYCIV